MDRLELRSPAKINLYLKVLGKRRDGYHRIDTIFEKIDLCDRIILLKRPEGIRVVSNAKDLPTDERNLAHGAACLLFKQAARLKKARASSGVTIRIRKNIPISAGLGGGSSNAASVLLGLNRLYNFRLSSKELLRLARKLGADVAFFIYGYSFARGTRRGDYIRPVLSTLKLWHLLIAPPFGISAKDVYASLDNRSARRPASGSRPIIKALRNKDLTNLNKLLYNNLEKTVLAGCAEIHSLKRDLIAKAIAKGPLVSGSGPVVFALTKTRKEAVNLRNKVKSDILAGKSDWRVYVVGTA